MTLYGNPMLGASDTRIVLHTLAMFFTPTSRTPAKKIVDKSKYNLKNTRFAKWSNHNVTYA